MIDSPEGAKADFCACKNQDTLSQYAQTVDHIQAC